MKTFIMVFFGSCLADTLYDSAGYADVITTVFGGRNARVAAEFVRQNGKKGWDELEKEMLNGQKLQARCFFLSTPELIAMHSDMCFYNRLTAFNILETDSVSLFTIQTRGPATLELVAQVIRENEVEHLFPLFMSTHAVAFENAKPQTILDIFRTRRPRGIQRSEDCVKLKVPTLVKDARARILARMKASGRHYVELPGAAPEILNDQHEVMNNNTGNTDKEL
ncbi:hypothetical protein Efla_007302 [Eimeria flavescens]